MGEASNQGPTSLSLRRWVLIWVLSILLVFVAFKVRSWAYGPPLSFDDFSIGDLAKEEHYAGPCTISHVFDAGCRDWAKEKVGDLFVWGSLLGALTMTIAVLRIMARADRVAKDEAEKARSEVSADDAARNDPATTDVDDSVRPAPSLLGSLGIAIAIAAIGGLVVFMVLGLILSGIWAAGG